MDSLTATVAAGTARLDERARQLGHAVLAGKLPGREAAGLVLAAAVETGVVDRMCARHHRGLSTVWDTGEITSAVTSMLVAYSLPGQDRPGRLDVTRFADGATSASGWVGKVIGTMRSTRILREMHAESPIPVATDVLERIPATGVEEQALTPHADELASHTRGLPATGATVGLIHASVLHDLLGLPPLRPWELTTAQRSQLRQFVEEDPTFPGRVLSGAVVDHAAAAAIGTLWGGWGRDDVAAMLAATTDERNIPHLLCRAAVRPLPRPTNRSGELARIRARARDYAPVPARPAVASVLEAFLDAEVAVYTDFDRIRRPLTEVQRMRREQATTALPGLLDEAARQLRLTRADVLSGLIGLLTEHVTIVDAANFTPTAWRFPQ